MALITCKDCKKEFSTDAPRCPHCGARKTSRLVSWGIFIVSLLFLLKMCSIEESPSPEPVAGNSSPQSSTPDDVGNAYSIGNQLKAAGKITSFDVSGWNRNLDVTISSTLPRDAQEFADYICPVSQQNFRWSQAWTVRIFLVVGERPAAECQTK